MSNQGCVAFRDVKREEKGYTLLEALVVLAIVAILSVLAVPRFQGFAAQREVDAVAREMAQQMETARVYAQANAVAVTGCPVASNQADINIAAPCTKLDRDDQAWSAWIWYVSGTGSAVSQLVARSDNVPAGVTLATGSREYIVFNAQGLATGFNGTITVSSAHAATVRTIVLASTGRITFN